MKVQLNQSAELKIKVIKGNQTMPRGGKREGAGRKKGAKDGKPRGTPPVLIAPAQERRELREAAREFTDDALKALVKICNGGQSESARIAAANALLDRGYGRPVQTIDSTIRRPGDTTGISDAELENLIREIRGTREANKGTPALTASTAKPDSVH
jgi:hypothetical protein